MLSSGFTYRVRALVNGFKRCWWSQVLELYEACGEGVAVERQPEVTPAAVETLARP